MQTVFRERSPKINFELQGTDSVQGQIYNHIFAQNRDSCDNCPSIILQRARKKKTAYFILLEMFAFGRSLVRLHKQNIPLLL